MTVTQTIIDKLRRMINEPTVMTYSDQDIEDYIENWSCEDELGGKPWFIDYSTVPPTYTDNTVWIPTYDINACAAELWEEKAAAIQDEFDFNADGGSYTRSQKYEQAINIASHYRSKSKIKNIIMKKYPREHKQTSSGDIHLRTL